MIPKKREAISTTSLCDFYFFIAFINPLLSFFFFFLLYNQIVLPMRQEGWGPYPSPFCAFLVCKAPAVIVYQGSTVDYLGCIFV